MEDKAACLDKFGALWDNYVCSCKFNMVKFSESGIKSGQKYQNIENGIEVLDKKLWLSFSINNFIDKPPTSQNILQNLSLLYCYSILR